MKTAIVTGASGGIGSAIAARLAGMGYDTAVCYKNGKEKAEAAAAGLCALGLSAFPLYLDVTDEASIVSAAAACEERGPLAVAVNNAGICFTRQIQDVSAEDIGRMFSVNTFGPILLCREAAKLMIPRKEGCIINVSSIWGETGASCESLYSSSKASLIALTRSLALELGPSGIRVNCIDPGVIDTPMNAAYSGEEMAALAAAAPLGRIGQPEDVAEAAEFLVKARFVTGQTVTVDGGFTL